MWWIWSSHPAGVFSFPYIFRILLILTKFYLLVWAVHRCSAEQCDIKREGPIGQILGRCSAYGRIRPLAVSSCRIRPLFSPPTCPVSFIWKTESLDWWVQRLFHVCLRRRYIFYFLWIGF
jgi:hypothetical protein